jgi:hypothetical protein
MPDPSIAQLIGSMLLALLTGTWQPAPVDLLMTAPQPVQFSGWWHPVGQPGSEMDLIVIGADGAVLGGASSSAVSSPRH